MVIGNRTHGPHYPSAPWGLGPSGCSCCLCTALCAVESPQRPRGGGGRERVVQRVGEYFLSFTAASPLPMLDRLTEKRGACLLHHSLELESRRAVPDQTGQIPVGSSSPFLDQWN